MSDQGIFFQNDSAMITDKIVRVGSHTFPTSDIRGISSEKIDSLDNWKFYGVVFLFGWYVSESYLFPLTPVLETSKFLQCMVVGIVSLAVIGTAELLKLGLKTRLTLHTTIGPVMVLESKDTATVARIQNAIETSLSKR